jgi:hypothetical protein
MQELQRERDAAEARLRELHRSSDGRIAELESERDRLRSELAAVQRQLQDLEKRQLTKREHDERILAGRARTHLAPAIRTLDESSTLGEALERLLESALAHCDRAVLLLLDKDRLRPWRTFGFEDGEIEARELSADAAGIAGTAVREGRVLTHAGDSGNLPSFVSSADIYEASAFPVTVAGAVVAVLYGDVADERLPDSTWIADVEVLARHASRVLEAITMQQAMGLRPVGLARPSQSASSASGATAAGASAPGELS